MYLKYVTSFRGYVVKDKKLTSTRSNDFSGTKFSGTRHQLEFSIHQLGFPRHQLEFPRHQLEFPRHQLGFPRYQLGVPRQLNVWENRIGRQNEQYFYCNSRGTEIFPVSYFAFAMVKLIKMLKNNNNIKNLASLYFAKCLVKKQIFTIKRNRTGRENLVFD